MILFSLFFSAFLIFLILLLVHLNIQATESVNRKDFDVWLREEKLKPTYYVEIKLSSGEIIKTYPFFVDDDLEKGFVNKNSSFSRAQNFIKQAASENLISIKKNQYIAYSKIESMEIKEYLNV